MRTPTLWQLFLGLAFLTRCSLAAAQEKALFGNGEIPVVASAKSFVEQTEGSREYPIDQSIVLTRKRSESARSIHSNQLRARLFRIGAEGVTRVPTPWTTIGDCEVYFSHVVMIEPPSPPNSTDVMIARFSDAWLTPNLQNSRMERARYLLVFESHVEGAHDNVFRIRSVHSPEYFAQGYLLILAPNPARPYTSDEVRRFQEQQRISYDRYAVEARQNAPSRICFRLKRITAEINPAESQMVSVHCEEEDQSADGIEDRFTMIALSTAGY